MYLWRAVDSEGEILDALVQPKRVVGALLREVVGRTGKGAKG
jgi:transposase-like protein